MQLAVHQAVSLSSNDVLLWKICSNVSRLARRYNNLLLRD